MTNDEEINHFFIVSTHYSKRFKIPFRPYEGRCIRKSHMNQFYRHIKTVGKSKRNAKINVIHTCQYI